jgi:hypothetical protein
VGLLVLAGPATAKTFGDIVPDGAGKPVVRPAHARLIRSDDLAYAGGPVLHSNRTHLIFWQPAGSQLGYLPGYQALVERFLADVAADSRRPTNVYSLSGQYRDSGGPAAYDSSYAGAVVATDPLPHNGCVEPPLTGPGWSVCLSDAQVETEIEHVIGIDLLPTSPRDIYFLVLPNRLGVCEDTGPDYCALGGATFGSFCGYHTSSADGSILYAVIPFNAVSGHCGSDNPRPNGSTADPALSTLSHEHNEIVTDPYRDAWRDASGNEDGDLCVTTFGPDLGGSGAGAWNQVIHGGHYYLQSEWSNWDGRCATRTAADSASFTLPARVTAGRPASLTAHARAAHGAITAYDWSFGDRGTSRRRSTAHTFRRAGSYRVVLRVTDSAGLWTFSTRTVRVGRASKVKQRVGG